LDHIRVLSFWIKRGYDLNGAEKRFLKAIRPSVRPPLIRPSVRHPSVRPYPRFILTPVSAVLDKTRICLKRTEKRFLDHIRILSNPNADMTKKRLKKFFESHPSVRHSSVRPPSVRPYPRFILTPVSAAYPLSYCVLLFYILGKS
jgi:hypothetical protein